MGRWLWMYNQAEKATQMGARMAVVTDYLSTSVGANFINQTCGGTTLTQGDRIPPGCFTNVTCDNTGCSPGGSVANYATKFNAIVTKMDNFMKPTGQIQPANVIIEYSQSGLGYAGTPTPAGAPAGTNSPDVAPVVTVSLRNMQFRPMVTLALATMSMPEFHTSLTFEDGTGGQSN